MHNIDGLGVTVKNFNRYFGGACFVALLLAGSATDSHGADSIFGRSYYSHADSPGYLYGIAPEPISAYRRPYRNPRPHFFVKGGFRINNVRIFNGSNSDTEYRREYWYDVE